MTTEKLSLANICEGMLEKQFQAAYPQILRGLKIGKGKSVITMKVELNRPAGTSAMTQVKATFDVKMPPNDPRVEAYSFNANDFKIVAEVQPAPEGEQNVLQFPSAVNK